MSDLYANVPEAAGFTPVYTLSINNSNDYADNGVPYSINNASDIPTGSFTRIGYFLELQQGSGPLEYAYVSFDASSFATNPSMLGVPTVASGEYYHYGLPSGDGQVTNMDVVSNVPGIVTGTNIATGSVEFWPSDYGTGNDYGVPNANGGNYDFGDGGSGTGRGYGSMQINNYGVGAEQTIIAFNNWNGGTSDLGIGNQVGGSGNPDWTFAGNAGSYTVKDMAIVVNTTQVFPSWNGTTDGNWTTASNWSTNSVPNAAGTPVVFGSQTGSFNSVDLGSTNETVGSLTFNGISTSIISSGGGTLTLDNSGSASTISVSGTQAISAPISLNNAVSLMGTGAITFSGGISGSGMNVSVGGPTVTFSTVANTFSGGFSMTSGAVNDNVIGGLSSASSITLGNSSSLSVNASGETLNNLTLNNTSSVNLNASGITLAGTTNLNGNDANDHGTLNFQNAPAAAPTINVNNNGELNVGGAAANLSNVTVNAGGVLQLSGDQGSAGGTAPTANINGILQLNSDTSAGYNLSMGNGSTVQAVGGTHTFAGNLSLASGAVNLGTSGQNLNLTGSLTGPGGVTQNGSGTTTLSGPASYLGSTNVTNGTLALQTNLSGGGNVAVGPAGTLNVAAGGSLGTSPLAINGGTATVTAPTNLGSAAVSLNSASSTLLFNPGAGNTATYSGSSISLNGGEVHVASGSADLGTAAITATTYVSQSLLGLQGYYYQNLNGAIYNVTGNSGSNVVALTQGATINNITPISSILTAAGSPNGTGLNFDQ